MGITFTDFWQAKGKLRSREVIVQDSLQEPHFHIPCSTPGVLCSHSRLTNLLFTPSCLCSFVLLYVVTKTSAEGVQSPSLNTSPWYKHQSPSKSSLSRTSVGAYLTESWGHLSETLQKQRGQRAEERKGVTTPPQHHHHPLPLLCQTPLSAAPTPNFLPLPLKSLFGFFSCSSSVSISQSRTLSLLRCLLHTAPHSKGSPSV